MESGKHLQYKFIVGIIVASIIATQSAIVEGRTLIRRELHPIDICIFSCDFCYKGETLITCANECITTEAEMSSTWSRTCKLFSSSSPSPTGLHDAILNGRNFMP